MSRISLPLALLLTLAAGAARADTPGPLDRPDVLAYSAFGPRFDGSFSDVGTYAGGAFYGNLSNVNTTPAQSSADPALILPLFVGGYVAGFTAGGAGARIFFTLDEPDTFSRNAKKISLDQRAWVELRALGFDGAQAFEAGPALLETCSGKATVKDRTGDGSADAGKLKFKCQSIDEVIAALGLTGAPADTVRAVFGDKKLKVQIQDGDGPSAPTN